MENKMANRLTPKQKRLVEELYDISSVIGMDYWDIARYSKESRTAVLEMQKRQAITGKIIIQYTLVDEMMSWEICRYFFGSGKDSMQLWRTKKFQNFNYYILERLYPLDKLRLVRSFRKVPSDIVENIRELDVLRNAVAHAFFPEDLRRYKEWQTAVYKKKDIFTLEGIQLFMDDMEGVNDFLFSKLLR
jgi:hypothetical protein